MVKDYQGSLELIFAYSYGCCAFKNNICGDRPEILDGMPDSANPFPLEFFVNLRCPSGPAAVEAKGAEVDQGGVVEDSKGGVVAKEYGSRITTVSGLLDASRTTTVFGLLDASWTITIFGLLDASWITIVSRLLDASRTTTVYGLLDASQTTTVSGLLVSSWTITVSGLLDASRTTTVSELLERSNCRF